MLYEKRGPMGMGRLLVRKFFETVQPVPFLPRIEAYIHTVAEDTSYYSEGFYRQNQAPHFLFQYTLRGEGIVYDRRGSSRIKAGQGFLVLPTDAESGYMYPENASEPWEHLSFVFSGKCLDEPIEKLLDDFGRIYTIDINHPVIQKLFAAEQDLPTLWNANESAAYCFSIYNMLVEAASGEHPKLNPIVEEIRRRVRDNIDSILSVESIASELGYSREYLCRLFRFECGESIKDYITRERTIRACYLLKNSDMSIREIAELMHCVGQSNFSRSFKAVVGLSPKEFRERGHLPMFL